MESKYFESWQLSISNDLLDAVELVLMTHGAELSELGLVGISLSQLTMFLAVAGCTKTALTIV